MRNLWEMSGPLRDPEPGAGGGDGAPAFDPVKFKAEIMADVTKNLNGGLSRIERQLAALKPATPPPGDDDGGDPPPDPKTGKVDPEVAKLRKQLEKQAADLASEKAERQKTAEAALEKERQSMIRQEIAKHGLADHSVDDAYRYFRDEIKRDESGELVGPEGIPFGEFISTTVSKRANWLPPRDVDGTGAKNSPGGRGTPAPFDLNNIKPGMSAEDRARALAAISAATT